MPLIRGHHSIDNQFTQIPNAWLRDPRLSLGSIGLLAQLLSHQPGWSISQESLARANGIGRDMMRTLLGELMAAGYLRRSEQRQRNEAGQLAGYVYTTQDPEGVQPMLAEPTQAEPTQVEPTHKNTIDKNTIIKNINRKERATRLPADWSPDERLLEMFQSKWPSLEAQRDYHIEQFKLYWIGTGKPMLNWDATFQKWMSKEQSRAPKRKSTDWDDLDAWAREQDRLNGN
jgi:hypothetical protein